MPTMPNLRSTDLERGYQIDEKGVGPQPNAH